MPDDPLRVDLRDAEGVQVGSGINIQFNQFGDVAREPARKAVWLKAAQAVTIRDPSELGIRPVLAVPGRVGSSAGLPELTPYIRRDHDAEIDAHLDGAASRLIVVTGSSCTGKSRALYEALLRHEEMRGWALRYPAGPEQLLDLLDGGHLAPRTVLWLTDLDHYLLTAAGESAAAALRGLLSEPSMVPVTVVATLWPGYWDELTEEPGDGISDRYPQARQLLTQQSRRVRIPEKFTEALLQDLADAADPRLSEAASLAGDGREVIQTLAGGPYLLDRYLSPGESKKTAFPRAVILSAIDARRLRLGPELPRTFLEQAAHSYLDPGARLDAPEGWPGLGLQAAERRQRGVSALRPMRWDTGRTGPADTYQLHDFLDQYGTRQREQELIPASFWEAASGTVCLAGQAHLALAQEAHRRFLYTYAQRCYRLAANAGLPDAHKGLISLLQEQGNDDAVQSELGLLRARARDGDRGAHRIIVDVLSQASRRPGEPLPAELRAAYEDAIRAGCEEMRERFADALAAHGAREDAIREFRLVLDQNPDAGHVRLRLIGLLTRQGETGQAAELADAAPADDFEQSLSELVSGLIDAGQTEQALLTVRSAVNAGRLPTSACDLGLAEKLGRTAGGAELLRLMADYGAWRAERECRRITAQHATDDELAQRDDEEALEERARRLAAADREDDLRRLAEEGDRDARWYLTLLLEEKGKVDEAIDVIRPQAYAAATTGIGALSREPARLVRLLEIAGRHEELHELVLSGKFADRRSLADWAYRHKRHADLEYLASYPDKYLRKRLAWLLRDSGDDAALRKLAVHSGAAYAELIDSLVDRDRMGLYRRVLLGEQYAQRCLRQLIENNDPRIPAGILHRHGLTPYGIPAEPLQPDTADFKNADTVTEQ